MPLWRAAYAIAQGRWAGAAKYQEAAADLGTRAGDPNTSMLLDVQRAMALDIQYRHAEMDLDWVERSAVASAVPAAWRSWIARVGAATGDHERASAVLRESLAEGPRMDLNWHSACELADAAADLGDREAAAQLHRLLEPHAALFAVVARGAASYSCTELHVGRLAATLGNLDEAETRLRRALHANQANGAEPFVAVTLWRLGDVLARRGEAGAARDAFAEAARRGEQLEMPALSSPPGG